MTTTGISSSAVAGSIYTATIEYANVSWSNCAANPSANVTLNILANGVVVSSGHLSGLAQGAPWTPVSVGWVVPAAYAGQAIQIQVVATNFIEGPGNTQQYEVPSFGFANATLTVTASGLPAAPSSLTATDVSGSQINLAWTNNAANQTGFQIDQATSSGFTQNLTTVTVGTNVTTYSATGLSNNITYYYRVRATNSLGNSANSSTASATTNTPIAIMVPDGGFEQTSTGACTPSSGEATLTTPQIGTIPGWTVTINPTTYDGGTYAGWEPYAQVTNVVKWNGPVEGSQYLEVFGGELFNGWPWTYDWPKYGIIPGQTVQLDSTGITATTVAGATYTATIAVSDPAWETADGYSPATLAADGFPVQSPNFELDIVANGQMVASNTLISPTAGQWYTLTTTWTATTSGQSIQLQAIASNFSEGQMGVGHGSAGEGPAPWTTSDAGFDNAQLTVTIPVSPPPAPSGLTATAVSASQINLAWTNNAINQTGFEIDQATSSDFTQNLTTATVGANVTSYNATGLSNHTTYYYRVRAINTVGDSANTSTASATTSQPGTPVAITVPDGDFASDTAGFDINANNGNHGPFVGPMTATLSGWTVTANPSTDNSGVYSSWNPYGGVDNTVTNSPAHGNFYTNYAGSMPGGATNLFFYYPGEQLTGAIGSQVAQTGAGLTLTTTGISATAVSGTTYTASIYYANLANYGLNNGPNVTLNILANGVVVGTGSLSGLAPGSPWTQVTAIWTATSHIGAAIQLQVVANNFLEGTQPWSMANFGLTHATLTATARRGTVASGDQRRGIWRRLGLGLLDPRGHGRATASLALVRHQPDQGNVQ